MDFRHYVVLPMTGPCSPWRIGADIGGTFTDLCLVDEAGAVFTHKTPTVPSDPSQGVLQAVDQLAGRLDMPSAALLEHCGLFIHGSTIATNALLERTGAKVGMLTTAGFRDTLEIRRGFRANVWDNRTPWSEVLVARSLRLAVTERTDAVGVVRRPVQRECIEMAAVQFREAGVQALAICFLNSYLNPANEHECRRIIQAMLPELHVTCSADIAPILGEYERFATAVVNAFLAPKVGAYLGKLDRELRRRGLGGELMLVQSNGGVASLPQLRDRPATLALSGPAAGASSIAHLGRTSGVGSSICIEIGGTSCDVTLVSDGQAAHAEAFKVDDLLISLPAVDIHTISTGGGTIAGVDEGGMLFAGPRGAGADPGPACYGLGGTKPTVTDAHLVLGRLRTGRYAQGRIQLDRSLAEAAILAEAAEPLATEVEQAAAGIIQLVEQNIKYAIERVSLERGLDPREFVIVGAGGAGGLHVAPIARELGCGRAVVPRLAGVFCAFGMCSTDVRHDLVRAAPGSFDQSSLEIMRELFSALEEEAVRKLIEAGFDDGSMRFEQYLDLKYSGQQWTISVAVDQSRPTADVLRENFERKYENLYGYIQPDGAIETVNARLSAFGMFPALPTPTQKTATYRPEPFEIRDVYMSMNAGFRQTDVYDGAELRPGARLSGPAIIEDATTTVLVGDGDVVEVLGTGDYSIAIRLT